MTGGAAGGAGGGAVVPLDVEEVAPGVFVHRGKPLALDAPGHDDIANIGFIIGTSCVAVIDTGGSVRIGRALHAAVKAQTSVPICYVINTHVHVDHVLGDAAFTDEGAVFVGHELLGAALARSRDFFLQSHAADLDAPASAAQIIGPSRSVAIGSDMALDLGGRALVLHAWPRAHTDCDLTVYDASSGTLWTGDLLFVQRTPAVDGSIKGWLAVSDALASLPLRAVVKHVVPGHGAPGTDLARALAVQRRYLQGLADTVRAQIARGEPLQDALQEARRAPRSEWLLWDATHPRNVARVYQELEWE